MSLFPFASCVDADDPAALSKDLYDDGYTSIVNIDYSPVVIANMAKQYADRPGMTCTAHSLNSAGSPR